MRTLGFDALSLLGAFKNFEFSVVRSRLDIRTNSRW